MTQEAGSQKQEVKLLPVAQMEGMSHHELLAARSNAKTKEEQDHIAPYEHRAFAREYVADNPVSGAVGVAVSIPAYQLAKIAGVTGSRSDPSLKQVSEGFKGIGEGISKALEPWKMNWNRGAEETLKNTPRKPVESPLKPWEMKWPGKGRTETKKSSELDLNNYLDTLSSVESGNNPKARAATSSATGLYQFTSGTWMAEVNRQNLPYTLADRTDPEKSREVVLGFTKENLAKAKKDLGRSPEAFELYMYHLFGKSGGGEFLSADRTAQAADVVSAKVYKANKALLEGKTVGEVLDRFKGKFK